MRLATPPSSRVGVPGQVTLDHVSWETYQRLVRERDLAGQHHKITYDRGRMVIMSPLPIHERVKRFIGRIIETASLDLGFVIASYGSTTWSSESTNAGLEPDECYYIGHEPTFDARTAPDLATVPPPDLAIEVDITNHPIDRLRLYAQLGVKEVWRFNGEIVEIFSLTDGTFARRDASVLLPFFIGADLTRFVSMFLASGEMTALREFRQWLQTKAQ